MRGGTANAKLAPITQADTQHLGDASQAYQGFGAGQPLLERRDQGLPAAQRLRLVRGEGGDCFGNGTGPFDIKGIHVLPLLHAFR